MYCSSDQEILFAFPKIKKGDIDMSAFACEPSHIGQLAIKFAEKGIYFHDGRPDAQQWAYALAWANINSLIERYNEKDAEFLVGESFTDYVCGCVQASRCLDYSLSAIQVIKMAKCFDYQADESSDYRNATVISDKVGSCHVSMLISCLINDLPGYDNAPWSYTGEGAPQAIRIA